MIGLYNLHKRSGKLKRSLRCDTKTLGIDAYVIPNTGVSRRKLKMKHRVNLGEFDEMIRIYRL